MNIETLERAKKLNGEIKSLERTLEEFNGDKAFNPHQIPDEMLSRHACEIREWLESELARKTAEFAAV